MSIRFFGINCIVDIVNLFLSELYLLVIVDVFFNIYERDINGFDNFVTKQI
ncbi:MAG: hypothetical protein Q8831_00570 ['Bonamia sp.' little leaf phytoplasma]|uniref:Uncharacterized protein n=1 Tax=Candidatus Phytoplasma bonamiae TaxID=2982626 RepID=A0ABT9D872_9MOLU|nr:hypothetical protein ['Bonamia sp.' little leaf phytoplasma]MDV3174536.1 hypothetical protein ['Bonamia sp.' little leaf phytoplasma]